MLKFKGFGAEHGGDRPGPVTRGLVPCNLSL